MSNNDFILKIGQEKYEFVDKNNYSSISNKDIKIEHLSLVHNPSYVKIESFIKNLFDSKLNKIMLSMDKNIKYKFIFDYNSTYLNPMAINKNNEITFKINSIKKYITLLDNKEAQETFLSILLIHELLHSIIKKGDNLDSIEYEYIINQWAKDILLNKLAIYSYRDLMNTTRRIKFGNISTLAKNRILDALLFPIEKGEYWIK